MRATEGPNVLDLVDGVHPGDKGYSKMAQLWFRGYKKPCRRGSYEHQRPVLKLETSLLINVSGFYLSHIDEKTLFCFAAIDVRDFS